MEEKIKAAIKIIADLGDNFSIKEWHEACVQICNLGLDEKSLTQFISQDNKRSVLGELEQGNPYVAANFINNFIAFNSNISYIKEWSFLIKRYINATNT